MSQNEEKFLSRFDCFLHFYEMTLRSLEIVEKSAKDPTKAACYLQSAKALFEYVKFYWNFFEKRVSEARWLKLKSDFDSVSEKIQRLEAKLPRIF